MPALSAAAAQQSGKAAPSRPYSHELPDMLLSYLAKKTNALAADWDRKQHWVRFQYQRDFFIQWDRQQLFRQFSSLENHIASEWKQKIDLDLDHHRV